MFVPRDRNTTHPVVVLVALDDVLVVIDELAPTCPFEFIARVVLDARVHCTPPIHDNK